MRILVNIARIIVGVLFIFSGLVKANDPLGLAYKMEEFFEIWHTTQFNSLALPFSVLMNAFEIIAGFALLLGCRIRLFSWLLFILILFFTFLTGYTYITGKPTNCGCFGDCLLISSKASFLKDVVLTILIAFILAQRKWIRPLFSKLVNGVLMLLATLFSFGLQWYALRYLPPIDCLPFKKGNNIAEKMKIPAGALPDSFAIRFVYKKAGKEFEFAPSELPADLATYEYVSRTDKLVRKGNAQPLIKGFALTDAMNNNFTDTVLAKPFSVLVFCENFDQSFGKWNKEFTAVYNACKRSNVPIYIITGRPDAAAKIFADASFSDVPIFSCDNTAIRTAARTNPCFYLLDAGRVVEKRGYHEADKITSRLAGIKLPPVTAAVIDTNQQSQ